MLLESSMYSGEEVQNSALLLLAWTRRAKSLAAALDRNVGLSDRGEQRERRLSHLANAVADPGAVVIELAHAVVADGAVRAARRAVVVACVAPLGAHGEAVHVVLACCHTPVRGGAVLRTWTWDNQG
jgi:hypothetical protein